MKIEEIEGIGPAYASQLRAAGVATAEALLEHGGKRQGREELSRATGISGKLLLEWTNRADLMRIKGVGSEYSDLLEAAGVDSPTELAHRNADNLTQAMATHNEQHKIVRHVPTRSEVERWIAEAKALPKLVE